MVTSIRYLSKSQIDRGLSSLNRIWVKGGGGSVNEGVLLNKGLNLVEAFREAVLSFTWLKTGRGTALPPLICVRTIFVIRCCQNMFPKADQITI